MPRSEESSLDSRLESRRIGSISANGTRRPKRPFGKFIQQLETETDTIGDRKSVGTVRLQSNAGLKTSRADAQLEQGRVGDFMTKAALHPGVLEIMIVEIIRPARVGAWPYGTAEPVKQAAEAQADTDERRPFDIIGPEGSRHADHGHIQVMLAGEHGKHRLDGPLGNESRVMGGRKWDEDYR